MDYVELRCKSNSSFLRGASYPEELVHRAAELGLKGMALCDVNGVYGLPRAWHESKGYPGFKLIAGVELTMQSLPALTLLARHRAAYGLMCRIITAAHADKPKGEAFLTMGQLGAFCSEGAATGLVALPLGWEVGPLKRLKEMFEGRLYLPVSRHFQQSDGPRVETAVDASRRLEIPLVATNDIHYHRPGRRKLQDVMTAIREGCSIPKAGFKIFQNTERHLKSAQEMAEIFKDMPEALARTIEIADSCTFSLSEIRYRYPSERIPAGRTPQEHLAELVAQGAKWRYPGGVPNDVRHQLDHEMKLVGELHFADYFLTIYDICQFAKSKGILHQGRGSAANSVVCYCLGITAIDPVRMKLLFERFISAERNEPPDIDVDFEHERREEVIQWIYETYGRDRAAMVAAVVTYKSRSAIREVSKALGVPLETHRNPEGRGILANQNLVQKLADDLHGFPRHLSIHSGGFVLSGDPLVECVPVEPARMEGRHIIQWDKHDLDSVGLLKIDVLALGMLTALKKSMDLVGIKELADIPAEDPDTYRMIQVGDTIGTFQIESRAQINMVGRLQPRTFYDLVIEVAIVRPGPIVGEMVHPYLKRRRGLEKLEYSDPRIEEILGRTMGVPLFQEQIMKLAIVLAKFTPGEADQLRRAIAAWRSAGSVESIGKRLMDGMLANGVSEGFARQIFKQIQGFSEYGFPESHAASFALLAYASAWVKCHHPAEFLCALLNSQPLGFYANHSLVDDARRAGVSVLPVHPNQSTWDCTMEGGAVRLGWREVNGLGEEKAKVLVARRKERLFSSLRDFVDRSELSARLLESLALGGSFDCFGTDRRNALWSILGLKAYQQRETHGQLGLFSSLEPKLAGQAFPSMDTFESVQQDYDTFGLSLDAHPMQALRARVPGLPSMRAAEAKAARHGKVVEVAGLVIVRQMPETAHGTVFAALEDETGFVDLIIRKELYRQEVETFANHSFLAVKGVMQKDGNSSSLLVGRVWAVKKDEDRMALKAGSRDWH
jgi:error-prone DNA polymerase